MSKTAGIIIIGDEVLNGSTVDTNSAYLCQQFRLLSVRVCKVSAIPDLAEIIGAEVLHFSKSFDIVITTGGVGPTHDGVTYRGVASAFNVSLREDEEMRTFYSSYLAQNTDSVVKSLFTIPSSANVIFTTNLGLSPSNNFPIVKIYNVFCLPGNPTYVRRVFPSFALKYFVNENTLHFSRVICLTVDEVNVATILNELVDKFKATVTFVSDLLTGDSQMKPADTKIRIESTSLTDCLNAEKLLISKVSPNWLAYPRTEIQNLAFIQRLITMETELTDTLKTSYQIIEECFNRYNINEIFLSFNGGKDCTVLLNLVCSFCMEKKFKQRLKLIYFQEKETFQEVDDFIEDIKKNYNVDVCTLPMPMIDSLKVFLQQEPNRKACFMGLRKTDPNSENLKPFQETDSHWPKVIRVSPILHWTYENVWDFLRCANIPYCSLYNRGYSSLGSRSNTLPNPALQFTNEDGSIFFRPAFCLEDRYERHGRFSDSNINLPIK